MQTNAKESKNKKEAIKSVIKKLHQGMSVEEVKSDFNQIISDITSQQLTTIEQELIDEGLPAEEVQKLCDVHVSLFKEELEKQQDPTTIEGHPAHVFLEENIAVQELLQEVQTIMEKMTSQPSEDLILDLKHKMNKLYDVDKHYLRKENLLFPKLEQYNFYGPSQVMWGIHDEIRDELKLIYSKLDRIDGTKGVEQFKEDLQHLVKKISEMIYKENKILIPTALDKLSHEDWYHIAQESDEIGYCLVAPISKWQPSGVESYSEEEIKGDSDKIKFPTGSLTLEELRFIFSSLPIDVTFIDENDTVRFFSNSQDRIFPRPKAVIGRKVQHCHPPKSVHVVEKILQTFKSGSKDSAEFWISIADKFVHIRYFAIRNSENEYLGTLEVSQDVTDIRKLQGEKRILSWA